MGNENLQTGPCGENVLMVFSADASRGIERKGSICVDNSKEFPVCAVCIFNYKQSQRDAAAAIRSYQVPAPPSAG